MANPFTWVHIPAHEIQQGDSIVVGGRMVHIITPPTRESIDHGGILLVANKSETGTDPQFMLIVPVNNITRVRRRTIHI
jgi:hypothetical protein